MNKNMEPLKGYKQKRDFSITPEPADSADKMTAPFSFVIQKHAARSLHYDFRLELDGVLKSWAVPKGPSLDPAQKRLAIRVEDHPLSYAEFEGVIPPRQYGAGTVIVWDRGTWEPIGDPREGLGAGHLKFRLYGEKLKGAWALVRMRGKPEERQEAWLLIKEHDAMARPEKEFSVVDAFPDSVAVKSEPVIPAGASPGALPPSLSPQLATLVDTAPSGGNWVYEIKFDGYRILARIDKSDVKLFTRNGNDWTSKLKSLVLPLKALNIDSGWLDGEIVVPGTNDVPDFGALQTALETDHTDSVQYFVFDLPFYAGFDLRNAGLADRRALLAKLLSKSNSGPILFSEEFAAGGSDILRSACSLGLEGIIGKRRDSPYVSGRSANWIKVKCEQRQEFVVIGYTESKSRNGGIGALLLGVTDDAGQMHYAGKVGTGFTVATSHMLKERLARISSDQTPLFDKPKDAVGNWVKPELVAEVSFTEWTRDGRVRHGVFKGLRSDKPTAAIPRETVQEALFSGVKISNPDRIIDASTGLRKMDLVSYYQLVAKWMLPHLANRPVAFLRAPSGIDGDLFFQKHGDALKIQGLKHLDPAIDPGHPALMEIDSIEALIGAAQMNVVEFHTWNATAKDIEKPDRVVFDLDPGEGLAWSILLEAAGLVHTLLDEIGLQNFLKTSGGKGLHVVAPLTPSDDWETVKGFSKAVVEHLARLIPSRFVAKSGPRNRIGKVYVDYLRNGRGATSVSAFSARARPGMGISMPCSWQELSSLTGGAQWTVANARERLESGEDPWLSYSKTEQTLREARNRLADI
ncbi:MAG: DNA ligase D [Negativicutes bacterium]